MWREESPDDCGGGRLLISQLRDSSLPLSLLPFHSSPSLVFSPSFPHTPSTSLLPDIRYRQLVIRDYFSLLSFVFFFPEYNLELSRDWRTPLRQRNCFVCNYDPDYTSLCMFKVTFVERILSRTNQRVTALLPSSAIRLKSSPGLDSNPPSSAARHSLIPSVYRFASFSTFLPLFLL